MTDDEFIRVFEAAMVPHDGWTHEAHIRMAWIYCTREQSLSMAITKAGEGIRRLNEANGVEPELYHETVTGAFMRLVSLRIPELEGDWPQFRDAHPELFDKESPILHRHYSKATLESEAARVAFVAPDKTSFAP
ncbi:MAG: hypothetical protein VCB26_08075 [Candidatus Hydrogenedentota bacterium]|jgi:hypothetical protein